jgi:GNAT superfamily N-acetyltransferase
MVALPIEPPKTRPVRKQALVGPTSGALGPTSGALGPEWLTSVRHTPVEKANPDGWYQHALTANGPVTGPNVVQLAETNLSPRERAEVKAFTRHTLERSDPHVHPFALPADRYTTSAPSWSVMVKADQQVVTHAGILYRVIQVGDTRVPVGAMSGVITLNEWRGRGYARAVLAKAAAFVAIWLWAPFALVICPREDTAFYTKLGWHVANDAPIWCDQPGGRVALTEEVAVYLSCQGDAAWPSGTIDLCGAPW